MSLPRPRNDARRRPVPAKQAIPHRMNARFWLDREVLSPSGRIKGVVKGVAFCRHAALCSGLALEIHWEDDLATFLCSDELRLNADGQFQEYD